MGEEGLDAQIGLFEAVAVQVGIVIGAGLFAVTGVAVSDAGPGVGIAYVIAIVAVSLSLVPTAILGSLYPTVGGNYRYPSRLWRHDVAFMAAWGMAVSVFTGGLPLYGRTFGQYLDSLVAVDPQIVGIVIVTLFFLVNIVGIEPAARVQQLLLLTLAVSLIVFITGGFPAVESSNLANPLPNGFSGVLIAGALLYFVCMGANFIVDIGGEMRDAALTIPQSFLISIPLILVVYVLTSLVAVGIVGWEDLAGEPLSIAADAALSNSLATFFTLGALFAVATTINAVYMIAPKYLMVFAADDLFPDVFGVVNERFGTAHWGLAFVYIGCLPFLLGPLSTEQHSSLMAFGSLVLVIPVMISAIKLVRDRPKSYAEAPVHIPPRLLSTIAGVAVVINIALLGLLAADDPEMFLVWLGLFGLGGIYYAVRSRYLATNGEPISERYEDLPEP
jgi:APA family basic amino acid/polyamine antiporter